MQIISEEMIKGAISGTSVDGIILVKNYSIQLTKTGKEYVVGKLQSGKEISFKSWGNSDAFSSLKNEDYQNVPSYITGRYDNYGGELSIIVETVQAVEGYESVDFFPVVYNVEAYWKALKDIFNTRVSDKCKALANKYLFENTEVAEKFKSEFAASSHHDNVKSGLLAHTYKVLAGLNHIFVTYPKLFNNMKSGLDQDFVDLVFFGGLMHDIGKTKEMHYGVYQKESIVTHRYLGIEFVNKDEIVSNYSEMWYYELVSIFLQHHGEFDDDCKTLASWIIHKADMLDSEFTYMQQLAENTIIPDETKPVSVRYNGKYLTLNF